MSETVAWISFLSGLFSAVALVTSTIYTARKGRQSTEQTTQQTTQVGFIAQLITRVGSLESQVRELWDLREKDATIKRRQGDHIDLLENHIWQQLPPPPPPRPADV